MTTTQLPLTDDADPNDTTRRFRLEATDDTEPVAHGVVFPPPTCDIHVVWRDGHTRLYDDLGKILDEHGDDLVWVDSAGISSD